ncbi:MAG TPA: hypothetical protein VL688_13145 [Verrucomicrobiae bacterium]|nr:hypothetical protein [Verrucomicrobiae bacterium]
MKKALGIFVFLLFTSVCAPAKGFSFDLQADWSDVLNPNGPWSYRQGDTVLPATIEPDYGDGIINVWAPPLLFGKFPVAPMLFKLTQQAANFYGTIYNTPMQAGEIVTITAPNNGEPLDPAVLANYRWTAPAAGNYDISSKIAPWIEGNPFEEDYNWKLFINNTLLASNDFDQTAGFTRANPDQFSILNQFLNLGDVIKLQLGTVTPQGSNSFDATFVTNLTINPSSFAATVPEPSTAFLMGLALLSMPFVNKGRALSKRVL